ncbi:hypothetical protein RJ639_015567 [Escallonia herrerae]|uniref:Reverse transcriptase/retrotransposon-derived protein RNase H-like domain-containing protein n=1 Tax=Escallonia herrerae TaxID=1293975 RepID=A0AA89ALK5_9ASTE|nr:hypothetical protein RJ639_015567 [Escallonia herrerae]
MGDVKDRLGYVEQNLQTFEDHVLKELESLKKAVMGQHELHTRFMELFANLQEQLDVVKVGVEEMRQETVMCKRAIAGGAVVTHSPRDAKELDNFIWHMERYFEGASITDEKAKVRTATLYLTDTATLWWRRKHNDIEKGLCTIDTWNVFKKEIKRQFYPENVTYEARKKLRELKHKSSIHDYVKDNTLEEHVEHLKTVFEVLRENELYVKWEKCSFAKEEVHFLGHIIKGGTLWMDKEKVKVIKEWEAPTKVSELRSFLGLANYYRRFIKGYSAKVAPLMDLLKKGKTWEWSKRCQSAFEGLKEAVTEEPVLALPDHTRVFELQTDASDFAIRGVLMQGGIQ